MIPNDDPTSKGKALGHALGSRRDGASGARPDRPSRTTRKVDRRAVDRRDPKLVDVLILVGRWGDHERASRGEAANA